MKVYELLRELKRSEKRWLNRVYRGMWKIFCFRFYYGKTVGKTLLNIRYGARVLFDWLRKVLFVDPVFRAYCEQAGKNIVFWGDLPWIEGDGLIYIGENVELFGKITILFGSSGEKKPKLIIGDRTSIGYGSSFSISKNINIGRNVLIAGECHFMDNDGHPHDYLERRQGKKVCEDDIKEIIVEDDVWIGRNVIIMKDVTIGRGSIIGAGSVVAESIPPMSIATGNPAKSRTKTLIN